ncbi:hypothetical protein CC2G_000313 [Coprinopsis cinerea AmutBmut pab1-1]|nr:hypothetical protein CC2G_000313 [Coprinopsis cinerea AmutBmut pab1-1]
MPKDNPPKQKRCPAHCTICIGRPLKSQCKCTKAGRVYLARVQQSLPQQALEFAAPPPIATAALPYLATPQVITTPPFSAPVNTLQEPLGTPSSATPSIDPPPPIITPMNSLEPTVAAPANTLQETLETSPAASPQIDPEIPIDPALQSVPPVNATANSSPAQKAPLPKSSNKKPRRATKSDPYNGFVDGAQCGNAAYEIVRGSPAPAILTHVDERTAAFLKGIGPLIARCEDLALKTNCWLFIGAQHVRSTIPVIHYTSPRLREDGAAAMEDVINAYCNLIHDLRSARRKEAFQLQQQLREKEKELEESERKREEYEQRLLVLEALLEGRESPGASRLDLSRDS